MSSICKQVTNNYLYHNFAHERIGTVFAEIFAHDSIMCIMPNNICTICTWEETQLILQTVTGSCPGNLTVISPLSSFLRKNKSDFEAR